MSSTTYSALQEKYTQAESTPPAIIQEEKNEGGTTTVAQNIPDTTQQNIETTNDTISENGVSDTVDFDLSFNGEELSTESTPTNSTSSTFNIDEEIKKLDKKTLLKKAGVNDFIINMEEYYSNGGKIDDYILAMGIDYNNISDEDLVKDEYRKKYSAFSKDEINRKFNRTFGISEDMSEEERDDRMLELKAEAHLIRQRKIEEQKKFKFPEPIPIKDEEYEKWKEHQIAAKQQYDNQINYYNNHAATKSLNESKRVAINFGDGVQPLNIAIDKPELITKALTDDGTIMQKLMTTQSGEPDVEKEQLVTLFAFNPQKFIQKVFNYGMQQGVYKKLVGENQNAQRPNIPVLPISSDAKPVFRNSTFGKMAQ